MIKCRKTNFDWNKYETEYYTNKNERSGLRL